jgi:hypothetical protein
LDFAAEDHRVTERNAALEKSLLVLKLCGPILDVGALLYCFKIAPNILASQFMAAGRLSRLCTLLCFLAILCLQLSRFFLILSDPASAFID